MNDFSQTACGHAMSALLAGKAGALPSPSTMTEGEQDTGF